MGGSDFLKSISQLEDLGVGIGLRNALFEETLEAREQIDWLEIVPENYMGKGGFHLDSLRQCMAHGFRLISHGVGLSIGSVDDLDAEYLRQLKVLFQVIGPPWFSDHLCFSSVDNVHLHDLLPLPFTWEAVDHVVSRIRQIQQAFDIPFLIENVSYYTQFSHQEMTEAQFISEILEQADCGLLLDVNNVYVNAQNHQEDPIAFLDQIPIERTVQIHIAGHYRDEHLVIDTHGEPVCLQVFDLLANVLNRTTVKGILLERDTNIPPMSEILEEISQIRLISKRYRLDAVAAV